ncbi:MAG: ThuA domain-containing protein [Propionibacteriaceae bacterium]|jgi:type 1 glutamine amidotransferase|nr:ThuA domain-containing protein [Propionibacteriaceae bacterium]
MPKALILSGAGRYADPWHSYADTSLRLEALAHDSGWKTTITDQIDETLAAGLDDFDLVIVNAGDPWHATEEGAPEPDEAVIAQGRLALATALERGISLLGVHAAANSLRDYPQWRFALGGEWTHGKSWHPAVGEIHIRTLHDEIVEGLSDFNVMDERYTALTIDRDIELLAEAIDDQKGHPIAWAHQYGRSCVIYDALGHDLRSFDSRGHRSLLRRALSWLLPRQKFDDARRKRS